MPAAGVDPVLGAVGIGGQNRSSSTGSNGNKAAPAGYDPEGNPMSRNQPCYCGSGKKFKNCHGVLEGVE
jgi:hypothetical protein